MSFIREVFKDYKTKGFYGVKRLIIKKYFTKKDKTINNFDLYIDYFKGKKGIEIGGISPIFKKIIPLYNCIDNLDGCNFSTKTIWEGRIIEGFNYSFSNSKRGFQYVCEANNLNSISSEKYDFLISSHCLEHCANTLKTIEEWLRVVKKGGAILLILPDKNYTFDHKRLVTKFNHLLEDFSKNVSENDLTHLDEILELHDLKMDLSAGNFENFKIRSLDNFNNRCLHHHVFDFELLKEIFIYFNIEIIDTSFAKPYHQIILGVKK
jgi:predicted SAM-dependent methyltransferase